ncbi:hypothetical protein PCE1_003168 [Barthelona sp. PCE]
METFASFLADRIVQIGSVTSFIIPELIGCLEEYFSDSLSRFVHDSSTGFMVMTVSQEFFRMLDSSNLSSDAKNYINFFIPSTRDKLVEFPVTFEDHPFRYIFFRTTQVVFDSEKSMESLSMFSVSASVTIVDIFKSIIGPFMQPRLSDKGLSDFLFEINIDLSFILPKPDRKWSRLLRNPASALQNAECVADCESVLNQWMELLVPVLDSLNELQKSRGSYLKIGPEFEFGVWFTFSNRFQQIIETMRNETMLRAAVNLLTLAKSPSLRNWRFLETKVSTTDVLIRDTLKHITPLYNLCKNHDELRANIRSSGELAHALLNVIRNSKFYSLSDNTTYLLRSGINLFLYICKTILFNTEDDQFKFSFLLQKDTLLSFRDHSTDIISVVNVFRQILLDAVDNRLRSIYASTHVLEDLSFFASKLASFVEQLQLFFVYVPLIQSETAIPVSFLFNFDVIEEVIAPLYDCHLDPFKDVTGYFDDELSDTETKVKQVETQMVQKIHGYFQLLDDNALTFQGKFIESLLELSIRPTIRRAIAEIGLNFQATLQRNLNRIGDLYRDLTYKNASLIRNGTPNSTLFVYCKVLTQKIEEPMKVFNMLVDKSIISQKSAQTLIDYHNQLLLKIIKLETSIQTKLAGDSISNHAFSSSLLRRKASGNVSLNLDDTVLLKLRDESFVDQNIDSSTPKGQSLKYSFINSVNEVISQRKRLIQSLSQVSIPFLSSSIVRLESIFHTGLDNVHWDNEGAIESFLTSAHTHFLEFDLLRINVDNLLDRFAMLVMRLGKVCLLDEIVCDDAQQQENFEEENFYDRQQHVTDAATRLTQRLNPATTRRSHQNTLRRMYDSENRHMTNVRSLSDLISYFETNIRSNMKVVEAILTSAGEVLNELACFVGLTSSSISDLKQDDHCSILFRDLYLCFKQIIHYSFNKFYTDFKSSKNPLFFISMQLEIPSITTNLSLAVIQKEISSMWQRVFSSLRENQFITQFFDVDSVLNKELFIPIFRTQSYFRKLGDPIQLRCSTFLDTFKWIITKQPEVELAYLEKESISSIEFEKQFDGLADVRSKLFSIPDFITFGNIKSVCLKTVAMKNALNTELTHWFDVIASFLRKKCVFVLETIIRSCEDILSSAHSDLSDLSTFHQLQHVVQKASDARIDVDLQLKDVEEGYLLLERYDTSMSHESVFYAAELFPNFRTAIAAHKVSGPLQFFAETVQKRYKSVKSQRKKEMGGGSTNASFLSSHPGSRSISRRSSLASMNSVDSFHSGVSGMSGVSGRSGLRVPSINLPGKKKRNDEEMNAAALIIQRVFRGYAVRKLMREMMSMAFSAEDAKRRGLVTQFFSAKNDDDDRSVYTALTSGTGFSMGSKRSDRTGLTGFTSFTRNTSTSMFSSFSGGTRNTLKSLASEFHHNDDILATLNAYAVFPLSRVEDVQEAFFKLVASDMFDRAMNQVEALQQNILEAKSDIIQKISQLKESISMESTRLMSMFESNALFALDLEPEETIRRANEYGVLLREIEENVKVCLSGKTVVDDLVITFPEGFKQVKEEISYAESVISFYNETNDHWKGFLLETVDSIDLNTLKEKSRSFKAKLDNLTRDRAPIVVKSPIVVLISTTLKRFFELQMVVERLSETNLTSHKFSQIVAQFGSAEFISEMNNVITSNSKLQFTVQHLISLNLIDRHKELFKLLDIFNEEDRVFNSVSTFVDRLQASTFKTTEFLGLPMFNEEQMSTIHHSIVIATDDGYDSFSQLRILADTQEHVAIGKDVGSSTLKIVDTMINMMKFFHQSVAVLQQTQSLIKKLHLIRYAVDNKVLHVSSHVYDTLVERLDSWESIYSKSKNEHFLILKFFLNFDGLSFVPNPIGDFILPNLLKECEHLADILSSDLNYICSTLPHLFFVSPIQLLDLMGAISMPGARLSDIIKDDVANSIAPGCQRVLVEGDYITAVVNVAGEVFPLVDPVSDLLDMAVTDDRCHHCNLFLEKYIPMAVKNSILTCRQNFNLKSLVDLIDQYPSQSVFVSIMIDFTQRMNQAFSHHAELRSLLKTLQNEYTDCLSRLQSMIHSVAGTLKNDSHQNAQILKLQCCLTAIVMCRDCVIAMQAEQVRSVEDSIWQHFPRFELTKDEETGSIGINILTGVITPMKYHFAIKTPVNKRMHSFFAITRNMLDFVTKLPFYHSNIAGVAVYQGQPNMGRESNCEFASYLLGCKCYTISMSRSINPKGISRLMAGASSISCTLILKNYVDLPEETQIIFDECSRYLLTSHYLKREQLELPLMTVSTDANYDGAIVMTTNQFVDKDYYWHIKLGDYDLDGFVVNYLRHQGLVCPCSVGIIVSWFIQLFSSTFSSYLNVHQIIVIFDVCCTLLRNTEYPQMSKNIEHYIREDLSFNSNNPIMLHELSLIGEVLSVYLQSSLDDTVILDIREIQPKEKTSKGQKHTPSVIDKMMNSGEPFFDGAQPTSEMTIFKQMIQKAFGKDSYCDDFSILEPISTFFAPVSERREHLMVQIDEVCLDVLNELHLTPTTSFMRVFRGLILRCILFSGSVITGGNFTGKTTLSLVLETVLSRVPMKFFHCEPNEQQARVFYVPPNCHLRHASRPIHYTFLEKNAVAIVHHDLFSKAQKESSDVHCDLTTHMKVNVVETDNILEHFNEPMKMDVDEIIVVETMDHDLVSSYGNPVVKCSSTVIDTYSIIEKFGNRCNEMFSFLDFDFVEHFGTFYGSYFDSLVKVVKDTDPEAQVAHKSLLFSLNILGGILILWNRKSILNSSNVLALSQRACLFALIWGACSGVSMDTIGIAVSHLLEIMDAEYLEYKGSTLSEDQLYDYVPCLVTGGWRSARVLLKNMYTHNRSLAYNLDFIVDVPFIFDQHIIGFAFVGSSSQLIDRSITIKLVGDQGLGMTNWFGNLFSSFIEEFDFSSVTNRVDVETISYDAMRDLVLNETVFTRFDVIKPKNSALDLGIFTFDNINIAKPELQEFLHGCLFGRICLNPAHVRAVGLGFLYYEHPSIVSENSIDRTAFKWSLNNFYPGRITDIITTLTDVILIERNGVTVETREKVVGALAAMSELLAAVVSESPFHGSKLFFEPIKAFFRGFRVILMEKSGEEKLNINLEDFKLLFMLYVSTCRPMLTLLPPDKRKEIISGLGSLSTLSRIDFSKNTFAIDLYDTESKQYSTRIFTEDDCDEFCMQLLPWNVPFVKKYSKKFTIPVCQVLQAFSVISDPHKVVRVVVNPVIADGLTFPNIEFEKCYEFAEFLHYRPIAFADALKHKEMLTSNCPTLIILSEVEYINHKERVLSDLLELMHIKGQFKIVFVCETDTVFGDFVQRKIAMFDRVTTVGIVVGSINQHLSSDVPIEVITADTVSHSYAKEERAEYMRMYEVIRNEEKQMHIHTSFPLVFQELIRLRSALSNDHISLKQNDTIPPFPDIFKGDDPVSTLRELSRKMRGVEGAKREKENEALFDHLKTHFLHFSDFNAQFDLVQVMPKVEQYARSDILSRIGLSVGFSAAMIVTRNGIEMSKIIADISAKVNKVKRMGSLITSQIDHFEVLRDQLKRDIEEKNIVIQECAQKIVSVEIQKQHNPCLGSSGEEALECSIEAMDELEEMSKNADLAREAMQTNSLELVEIEDKLEQVERELSRIVDMKPKLTSVFERFKVEFPYVGMTEVEVCYAQMQAIFHVIIVSLMDDNMYTEYIKKDNYTMFDRKLASNELLKFVPFITKYLRYKSHHSVPIICDEIVFIKIGALCSFCDVGVVPLFCPSPDHLFNVFEDISSMKLQHMQSIDDFTQTVFNNEDCMYVITISDVEQVRYWQTFLKTLGQAKKKRIMASITDKNGQMVLIPPTFRLSVVLENAGLLSSIPYMDVTFFPMSSQLPQSSLEHICAHVLFESEQVTLFNKLRHFNNRTTNEFIQCSKVLDEMELEEQADDVEIDDGLKLFDKLYNIFSAAVDLKQYEEVESYFNPYKIVARDVCVRHKVNTLSVAMFNDFISVHTQDDTFRYVNTCKRICTMATSAPVGSNSRIQNLLEVLKHYFSMVAFKIPKEQRFAAMLHNALQYQLQYHQKSKVLWDTLDRSDYMSLSAAASSLNSSHNSLRVALTITLVQTILSDVLFSKLNISVDDSVVRFFESVDASVYNEVELRFVFQQLPMTFTVMNPIEEFVFFFHVLKPYLTNLYGPVSYAVLPLLLSRFMDNASTPGQSLHVNSSAAHQMMDFSRRYDEIFGNKRIMLYTDSHDVTQYPLFNGAFLVPMAMGKFHIISLCVAHLKNKEDLFARLKPGIFVMIVISCDGLEELIDEIYELYGTEAYNDSQSRVMFAVTNNMWKVYQSKYQCPFMYFELDSDQHFGSIVSFSNALWLDVLPLVIGEVPLNLVRIGQCFSYLIGIMSYNFEKLKANIVFVFIVFSNIMEFVGLQRFTPGWVKAFAIHNSKVIGEDFGAKVGSTLAFYIMRMFEIANSDANEFLPGCPIISSTDLPKVREQFPKLQRTFGIPYSCVIGVNAPDGVPQSACAPSFLNVYNTVSGVRKLSKVIGNQLFTIGFSDSEKTVENGMRVIGQMTGRTVKPMALAMNEFVASQDSLQQPSSFLSFAMAMLKRNLEFHTAYLMKYIGAIVASKGLLQFEDDWFFATGCSYPKELNYWHLYPKNTQFFPGSILSHMLERRVEKELSAEHGMLSFSQMENRGEAVLSLLFMHSTRSFMSLRPFLNVSGKKSSIIPSFSGLSVPNNVYMSHNGQLQLNPPKNAHTVSSPNLYLSKVDIDAVPLVKPNCIFSVPKTHNVSLPQESENPYAINIYTGCSFTPNTIGFIDVMGEQMDLCDEPDRIIMLGKHVVE